MMPDAEWQRQGQREGPTDTPGLPAGGHSTMDKESLRKKLNLKLIKYLDQGFSTTGNPVPPEYLATSGYIFNGHDGGEGRKWGALDVS